MKRILSLLLLVAMTATWARADLGGYKLRHVDIDAIAHENGYWDVTETLQVEFLEPRHGIYKYIPSIFYYAFEDDYGNEFTNKYKNGVEIKDVPGYEYSVEEDVTQAENTIVKIGSSSKTVTGLQTYVIRYEIRYLNDRYDGEDFLCHTIWGHGWDVEVDSLDYSITFDKQLPEDFDQWLNVYSGEYGNAQNVDSLEVWLDDEANIVWGSASHLPANHAITVSAYLPEGYWSATGKNRTLFYIFLSLTVACAVWYLKTIIFKRRREPVPVVSFYPPDGMSSAEVGKVIDDSTDTEDLASLIPWMASKGYITIEDIPGEKGLTGRAPDVCLRKVNKKPLPAHAPKYQHKFMKAIFGSSNEVYLSRLGDRHTQIAETRQALDETFTGERALVDYDGSGCTALMCTYVMALCAYASVHILDIFNAVIPVLALFSSLGAAGIISLLRITYATDRYNRKLRSKILHYVGCIMIALVGMVIHLAIADGDVCVNWWAVQAGGLALVALSFTAGRVVSNTDYRLKLMGELMGLREFIKTAELPRLKMLVDENPSYFYDVLPYAMVFGLSNKWVKQFAAIEMKTPDWYSTSSTSVISSSLLASSITSSMTSHITSSIAKASVDPSSSSSGGGGSFSGGGGGGGGGGSW